MNSKMFLTRKNMNNKPDTRVTVYFLYHPPIENAFKPDIIPGWARASVSNKQKLAVMLAPPLIGKL